MKLHPRRRRRTSLSVIRGDHWLSEAGSGGLRFHLRAEWWRSSCTIIQSPTHRATTTTSSRFTMSPYSLILALLLAASSLAIQQTLAHQSSNQDLNRQTKKCVPLFDRKANQQSALGGQRLHQNNAANFSFQVGDIDLPLVPAEGSIQSAMRLLSTFNSQLDPIIPGEEEEDEEDGEDDESSHNNGRLNVVKFRDNKLHLNGLNLSMLNVHLYPDGSEPKFGIGLTIKNTTLDGRFVYKGPLVPLTTTSGSNSLKGFYSMSIENIYLLVSSNLTKVASNPAAAINESTPAAAKAHTLQRLQTSEFRLNVTNLGYISIDIYDSNQPAGGESGRQPTSNYVLKMLQKVLQRTIKRTYLTFEHHIRRVLELEGRRVLDCELTRFDDLLQINSSNNSTTSNKQGDLARVIDHEIVNSGFSRVELPDFDHQQSVFGSTARISFYNGSLSGLNTIKMIGETRVKLQDQHLIMNTSLGWLELRPYYNWNLTLGSSPTGANKAPVSQGFVSFAIKDFDFDAVITKGLQDSAPPQERRQIVVEQLVIRHLDTPKMDIGGLPGMNRVTRAMVNFFMGRLKQRLTGAIQPVLKQQLERSLNKILM